MFSSAFRRRRPAWSLMSPEALESRDLLSATAFGELGSAVAAEVAPAEGARAAARKGPGPLTGQWSIPTDFGTLEIDSVQKGKKVKGTIDLGGVNLSSLSGLPSQTPKFGGLDLSGLELPTIEYVGKFKDGVLQVSFKTTVNLPFFGSFQVQGSLDGTVNLVDQTLSGHLAVQVNGDTVLDTDFSVPLPELPVFPSGVAGGRRASRG